ncbi:hypothetical protein ACN4EE_07070 [Geminocystis sp. CENA526]|uniref:hypothetical protein n=1 Tax=Geminocystis sp. CENA526 TaxID=1355871 RepID=UPI003D6E01F6
MAHLDLYNQQTTDTLIKTHESIYKSISEIREQLANTNNKTSILELQKQLEKLNDELDDNLNVIFGQQLLTRDWNKATDPLVDLFKAACGVYKDPEVLDAMVAEIQAIASAIKKNFEELKTAPTEYIEGLKEYREGVKKKESETEEDPLAFLYEDVPPDYAGMYLDTAQCGMKKYWQGYRGEL